MSGTSDKLYGRIAAVSAIQAGIANVLVVNTLDRSTRSMAMVPSWSPTPSWKAGASSV